MKTRNSLAVFALLVLLLAGCSSPQGDEKHDAVPPAQDVRPDAGTGAISGVVVDETIVPIGGANVSLIGDERSVVANDRGQFIFKGLEAGTYFVAAEAKGFDSTETAVVVEAGETSKPKILLARVPVPEPYHTTHAFQVISPLSTPASASHSGNLPIELDTVFETVIFEAQWDANLINPLDEPPFFHRIFSEPKGYLVEASTHSPAWAAYDATGLPEGADELRGITYPQGEAVVAVDSEAQVFITVFYREAAPNAWSFIAGDS